MTLSPRAPTENSLDGSFRDLYLAAFQAMVRSRELENKLSSLYRAGGRIVGGMYLGKGQEAFSAAMGVVLQKGKDLFSPLIRDQAGRLAFGEAMSDAAQTYLGSRLGPMKGRDGNIHRGRPQEGITAMISHLGSMISVLSGMLLAKRFQGVEGVVGSASIGDGGTSTGAFHEGLNLAAVEKLPLVIGIANNQYAYSTPTSFQYACEDLALRAEGYGVEAHRVDGTNLLSSLQGFYEATKRAREGRGPQLVVGTLLRLSGHGEHDDASYVPSSLREDQRFRDCITSSREWILSQGWMTESELDQWKKDAEAEAENALSAAAREPAPDPYDETWCALSCEMLNEGWRDRA